MPLESLCFSGFLGNRRSEGLSKFFQWFKMTYCDAKTMKWCVGRTLLVSLILWFALGLSTVTALETVWDWSEHSKILPTYCKHRQRGLEGAALYPHLKPIWKHIHHYCAALYGVFKAQVTIEAQAKQRWLNESNDNFKYMAKRCRLSECVIYPELYTYWGIVFRERGNIKEAVSAFEKAIRAKPDYDKAYAELAALFLALDKIDRAVEILKKGLKKKPTSHRLKRMLKKLGSPQRTERLEKSEATVSH